MHVLIVDDEPLARAELAYLVQQSSVVEEVREADSIEEALARMLEAPVDLLFLDIHLTEESGLTLAEKLKRFARPPQIIFATAYEEYALKAFEVNATDYILKPFEQERVLEALEKARLRKKAAASRPDVAGNEETTETVVIAQEERIFVVKVKDIVALTVESGETTISTRDARYTSHDPLVAWEKKLPADQFLRVHRAYILNLGAISEIQPWFNHTYQVTLVNGDKVPVSRSYVRTFRERVGF